MRGRSGQASSASEYSLLLSRRTAAPLGWAPVPRGPNKLAMNEDTPLLFYLPAVARKRANAAFDGGRITSDRGVMLLAQARNGGDVFEQHANIDA